MIYLSSTTNLPDRYKWAEFGVMFSAKHSIGGLSEALDGGAVWMMDNNAFTSGFDAGVWLGSLLKYRSFADSCAGIPVPDIVGDALGTLQLFSRYHQIVRDLGYPVAFVSQNGITPEITPWDWFDVLFVGGDDDHKLGPEAGVMIAEAKSRGKAVHVGRVNSAKRIKQFWMCDSVDGTRLTFDRKSGHDTTAKVAVLFASSVQWCNNRKTGTLGTNGQYNMSMGGA